MYGEVVMKNKNIWWVNHNKNWKEETSNNYLWSPKKNSNGSNNEFYKNMTRARSGDLVFSYSDSQIKFIGIVLEKAKEHTNLDISRKEYENRDGWKLPVYFIKLTENIRLKDNLTEDIIDSLDAYDKYSPFLKTGNAKQGAYFSEVKNSLFLALKKLINNFGDIVNDLNNMVNYLNNCIEMEEIIETEKEAIIKQRIGQSVFKKNVNEIEKYCRLTKIDNIDFLIASHIKPWKDCNSSERLDKNNGLLLSPHIDKLFDNGYISFENNGDVIISKKLPKNILEKWYIKDAMNVGEFNSEQSRYLEYHRKNILKKE